MTVKVDQEDGVGRMAIRPIGFGAEGATATPVSAANPLPVTSTVEVAATASRWQYAAATGGISNTTTAVTVAAAAGASLRNYVSGVQISWDALGAATELAIRDGAGGTVLWRQKIPAGVAGILDCTFPSPIKGTANTLLEVVTLTASVSGGVFFNAQGYTGS